MHALMLHTKKKRSSIGFKFWSTPGWLYQHCCTAIIYFFITRIRGLNSPNFGRQYTNVHGRNNKWPTNHNRTPEMNKIRHRKLVFWMGFYSSGKRHPSRQPQNHAMLTSLGQVGIVALILTIISSYFQWRRDTPSSPPMSPGEPRAIQLRAKGRPTAHYGPFIPRPRGRWHVVLYWCHPQQDMLLFSLGVSNTNGAQWGDGTAELWDCTVGLLEIAMVFFFRLKRMPQRCPHFEDPLLQFSKSTRRVGCHQMRGHILRLAGHPQFWMLSLILICQFSGILLTPCFSECLGSLAPFLLEICGFLAP